MMSARAKKILYSVCAVLPTVGLLPVGLLTSKLEPILVTVIISVYIALWAGLCYLLYKKIAGLSDKLQLENMSEQIVDLPKEDFLGCSEKKLIEDGFEKRVDSYIDGEVQLTATCFYRTTEKQLGMESETVIFLEGVKAFSDLINTESNLRDSHLNCLSDPRLYRAFSQVVAIVSPYPDPEIYDFCVKSFYNHQNGVLFLACDKAVSRGYYASPIRHKTKSFERSEALVKRYLSKNTAVN